MASQPSPALQAHLANNPFTNISTIGSTNETWIGEIPSHKPNGERISAQDLKHYARAFNRQINRLNTPDHIAAAVHRPDFPTVYVHTIPRGDLAAGVNASAAVVRVMRAVGQVDPDTGAVRHHAETHAVARVMRVTGDSLPVNYSVGIHGHYSDGREAVVCEMCRMTLVSVGVGPQDFA